ncbi:hypothetical protein ES332_A01G107000v1 [Gossypium tomentosum]|uniref:DEK C-terminal domain-containing protein n=1 Tax=Gossypium tomentosum TaxID=34277 RepID=A0A5D2RNZ8_GOSTO|nr:hypothetical protein ES332_A01G107000v1 [Gossypium tomentosum]
MGEEKASTKVPKPVANGTSLPEKSGVAVAEKIEEENNVVKEMKEDKKDNENVETEKMDEDQKGKQDKESKEKFEEGKKDSKTEAMEEESHSKVNDKEVKKEENKDEVEEKVEDFTPKIIWYLTSEHRGSSYFQKMSRKKVQNSGEKVKEKIKKRTPLKDRPVREHKSVERLVAFIDKDASREFQIKKGRGTVLKPIPNGTFKLSRRTLDDTLRLHTILFGRREKVKCNISRFSSFVWLENEEKQKTKVKEKLLEFCDMLDIPSTRATARKSNKSRKLKRAAKSVTKSNQSTKVLVSTCKMVAKGKDKAKKRKVKPSDYELRTTICGILKEVDFNTSLYVSVQRFDTDLTPRKLSTKLMIQEELTKLADDEDGEEDGEKDGAQSAGQELEA